MPYLGLLDGERVIPPQVPDEATVTCPSCSGAMSVVTSHRRRNAFVSRHFRHHTREDRVEYTAACGQGTLDDWTATGKCPGESDIHLKMKSIAYARLEYDFPDATVELESGLDGRIADVLLTFPEPRSPYGKGIAIEAQYRNEGKDIDTVTTHYLDRGYSVAWVYEDDFTSYDVDLSGMLTLWPYALPDRSGFEGYSDIIRWLKQDKSVSVELEIPIPAEYWASFDKSGEWVTIAKRDLRHQGRAWLILSRTPDGHFVLQLGKKDWGYGGETHRLSVEIVPDDSQKFRSFAEQLATEGFETDHPSKPQRDEDWVDLTTTWLAGAPTVTAWLSASLSPKNNIIISLWKKTPVETEHVSVEVDRTAVTTFRTIADLFDRALELERT